MVQLLQVACAWFLLLALGETENHLAYLVIFLVSSAVAVLPISIGGVGVQGADFSLWLTVVECRYQYCRGDQFPVLPDHGFSVAGKDTFVFRPVKLQISIQIPSTKFRSKFEILNTKLRSNLIF